MAAPADTLRIATYNTELHQKGPGLLLRNIVRGEDPKILAVMEVLTRTDPDIVVLQGFDYDLTGAALDAFAKALAEKGTVYPHLFAARPNTGLQTGLDMNGDGKTGTPQDAQGYGRFSGQGGMAVLSRFPIATQQVQDFTSLLWRDLPGANLPAHPDGTPFPSVEVLAVQRLSTTAHWVVPIDVPDLGRINLLTFHASPPVFDGTEDRNGKRNHDELMFWLRFLDGDIGQAPQDRFVLLGDANNDRDEGEGLKPAITALLNDRRLQDPSPISAGSMTAGGDPDDTVDWDDPSPGNLRVDYVLPSSDWRVEKSGVYWPDGPDGQIAETASRHRLVWVDLAY